MKLNDVLKSKSYITLVEKSVRTQAMASGVYPAPNNKFAFVPDGWDSPVYVFDTMEAANEMFEEATRPGTKTADVLNKYKSKRVQLEGAVRSAVTKYSKPREMSQEAVLKRAAKARPGTPLTRFVEGNGATLLRGLRLAGIGTSAFYGVAIALQDVAEDPTLSDQEKEQISDILRGQLLAQLVTTLMIIFRSSALIRKSWPVWAIVIAALGTYGAIKESKQADPKERLDEVAPLAVLGGAALWTGLRTAGQWLVRGAITRAAAARTATSAAARNTATKAATAATSRATIANLAKMAPDVAAAMILASPQMQRWLAEAIAGWSLTDFGFQALGNGVEGLVDAAAEIFPGTVTNFLQKNLNRGGYEQTTTGGGGEYFGNTEWAKNVFGSMLFPPEQKSKLVPYIGPGRREDLLNGAMNLNPIDSNQPQPEEPSVNSGAPGFRPGQ